MHLWPRPIRARISRTSAASTSVGAFWVARAPRATTWLHGVPKELTQVFPSGLNGFLRCLTTKCCDRAEPVANQLIAGCAIRNGVVENLPAHPEQVSSGGSFRSRVARRIFEAGRALPPPLKRGAKHLDVSVSNARRLFHLGVAPGWLRSLRTKPPVIRIGQEERPLFYILAMPADEHIERQTPPGDESGAAAPCEPRLTFKRSTTRSPRDGIGELKKRLIPIESRLRTSFAVFRPDDATKYIIDRVQLTLSPRPGVLPKGIPTPRRDVTRALEERKLVESRSRTARWPDGDSRLTIGLGRYHGSRSITGGVIDNVISRVRAGLIATGRIPPDLHRPGDRSASNFIPPEVLPVGIDLHELCLDELLGGLLSESQRTYAEAFTSIFGISLEPADVRARLAQIELTWDRPCALARAAPTNFWPAWRDAFYGASFLLASGEREAREEAGDLLAVGKAISTEHREDSAAPGSAVLRAGAAVGNGAKLYAKYDHLLRFEVEASKRHTERVLGRVVWLDSRAQVETDLAALVAHPYRTLMRVQETLLCSERIDLAHLLKLFASKKALVVLEAFVNEGWFVNSGSRFTKTLRRLKRLGVIEHEHRGYWRLAPNIARYMHHVQWRARHWEER